MRTNALTKEQVHSLKATDVHKILSRTMLVDGFPFTFDFKKSQGMYIYDSREGKYYLDFFSFFASWALGHNHPKLDTPEFREKMGYIAAQNPSNSDIYTIEMAQFVATFERVAMPDEFQYLFFIDGGALAVENAIKTAFDWKVRKNIAQGNGEKGSMIIHFKEAFHGRSGYTLSCTNTFDPNKTKYFAKFDWPRIDNPKIVFPLDSDNIKQVEQAEKRAVEQIELAFARHGDDIAGIIIEPIQAEGGDNHFRKEFFDSLRRIADRHDVMLIFDEVQTGLGMTGKTWGYEHTDVVPDIIAFGKKTQVCGIMVTRRIDEVADNVFKVPSRINSTWGGNITSMVRAQRIFEIIEEENLVEHSAKVGVYLLEKLHELEREFPRVISNVRGKGLMCAFDLPDSQQRNELRDKLFEKGMIILPCGAKSLRFRPALICEREHIDRAGVMLREAIKAK